MKRNIEMQERSARPLRRGMVVVVVVGTLLTLIAAVVSSMPGSELVELVLLAGGTAVIGAIAAIVLVMLAQNRSFAAQAASAAAAALVPVFIGVWVASREMILDEHAFGALTVVLCAAGTVALVTALVVGQRVVRASDSLIDTARHLGEGAVPGRRIGHGAPEELTRLHHELEQTSARLEEARKRERALESSRRELVAWVSHDLRTPLAGIKALAEALEDGVADDEATVARYHRALGVEVDRLNDLVDDLFELSRAQAGVLRLELERVSLGDLVSDAIASASPVATAKGVHLHGRLVGDPLELEASPPEVLRALRNILENAIRHTPADGTITVEAGLEQDRAYVSVVDDGGGIPEVDLPRVFDVAFRSDAARTPGDGAGLGLAIARGLVEAHHGDVTVENQNGGACFIVRLPLEAAGVS
jgi:signal transduction histidine kinase